MNQNSNEKLRDLDILDQLEKDPDSTQAVLAGKLNVAVGTINWHLKRLVKKGCLKIQHCEKRKLKYIITPEGIALRSRLTADYIQTSFELYRLIRSRMNAVLDELSGKSYKAISLKGDGEVAEICRLTCLERNFQIVDFKENQQVPVVEIKELKLFITYPKEEKHD